MFKTEKEKAKIIRRFVEDNPEIIEKAEKLYNKHDIEVSIEVSEHYSTMDKLEDEVEYWYYNTKTKELSFRHSYLGSSAYVIYDWLPVGTIEITRTTSKEKREINLKITKIIDPIDHCPDFSMNDEKERKTKEYLKENNLLNKKRLELKRKEREKFPTLLEDELTREQVAFFLIENLRTQKKEYCRKCGKKVYPKLNKIQTLMFNEYFSNVDYDCVCGYNWEGKITVDITSLKESV